ncbi:MAG TPA: glycosyltransferase family 4 protein [Bryobacteraceae bacterium]|nr:glycosyltransferase family 4 protein [Bryobacteraceae bacterium]
MRILLTANASYAPPRGGATRSNLLWLEFMAARGHPCRVVAGGGESVVPGADSRVEIHAVAERARHAHELRRQIQEFQPDWVLVSSEDLGHVLLREAQHSAAGRVVYLAHTPQFFPFGPASWNPDPGATALVTAAAGIVAIGHHTGAYIRHHAGREAAVIHPPVYGSGPFPNLAAYDAGLVTMVNPCAVKGISIFLALAERFPQCGFGALPGWGTTSADRAQLAACPNVEILPGCRHITDFLGRSRILLMPSLWYEGFGLIAMEAMLHGIPVIASDSGGLVEAKMSTPFVVPTPGIQRYQPVFDEHALPKPVIGPLNLEPWADTLRALLGDRELYEQVSAASRTAALQFVGGLDAGRMLAYLQSLEPADAAPERPSLANLSAERRALLLRKARAWKP